MAEDLIGYQRLIEQALRGVVRATLAGAAKDGLPGRHHLYITFRTDHPGVVVADSLRARYPTEMTIVLQYEFWDLEVEDDGFGVTLSFGGVPQRLWVPFAAVKLFTDPAAEFGLQFAVPEGEGEAPGASPAPASAPAPAPAPAAGKAAGRRRPVAVVAEAGDGGSSAAEGGDGEGEAEKVVSLDRFRSK